MSIYIIDYLGESFEQEVIYFPVESYAALNLNVVPGAELKCLGRRNPCGCGCDDEFKGLPFNKIPSGN